MFEGDHVTSLKAAPLFAGWGTEIQHLAQPASGAQAWSITGSLAVPMVNMPLPQ